MIVPLLFTSNQMSKQTLLFKYSFKYLKLKSMNFDKLIKKLKKLNM